MSMKEENKRISENAIGMKIKQMKVNIFKVTYQKIQMRKKLVYPEHYK
jgi:hypothetical protein